MSTHIKIINYCEYTVVRNKGNFRAKAIKIVNSYLDNILFKDGRRTQVLIFSKKGTETPKSAEAKVDGYQ